MTCWDVMPCSFVDRYQYLGGTCCLNLESSSILKIKAVVFSEIFVTVYQTAWCNFQEGHNLNIHCHRNLKKFLVCPQIVNSTNMKLNLWVVQNLKERPLPFILMEAFCNTSTNFVSEKLMNLKLVTVQYKRVEDYGVTISV